MHVDFVVDFVGASFDSDDDCGERIGCVQTRIFDQLRSKCDGTIG